MNNKKEKPKWKDVTAFRKKYAKVDLWAKKLQRSKNVVYDLMVFCWWADKTPDELLALKDDRESREAELLLDAFVTSDIPEIPKTSQWRTSVSVKSFFKHSYRALESAAGIMTCEKVKPYYTPTKDEVKRLVDAGYNPRDRLLPGFACVTGIAVETLTHLIWGHLEEDWEQQEIPHLSLPDTMIKGHGRGKYKGVRQETFVTPEVKKLLLEYKQWYERKFGEVSGNDPLIINVRGPKKAMGMSDLRQVSGLLKERTGLPFSWHDGRRFLETALEQVNVHPNWARKIRGRKVRGEEAPYSKPKIEQLRQSYKEALPHLTFMTPTVDLEARVKAVEKVLESIPPEQRELMKKYGITMMRKERHIKAEEENSEDCPDGENCGEKFRQIGETELLKYLEQGWRIVHNLQNGEVIVKR